MQAAASRQRPAAGRPRATSTPEQLLPTSTAMATNRSLAAGVARKGGENASRAAQAGQWATELP